MMSQNSSTFVTMKAIVNIIAIVDAEDTFDVPGL